MKKIAPLPFFTVMECPVPFKKETVKTKTTVWGEANEEQIKLLRVEVVILEPDRQQQVKDKDFQKEIRAWIKSQYFIVQIASDMMEFGLTKNLTFKHKIDIL
jgi:hypothetical protein